MLSKSRLENKAKEIAWQLTFIHAVSARSLIFSKHQGRKQVPRSRVFRQHHAHPESEDTHRPKLWLVWVDIGRQIPDNGEPEAVDMGTRHPMLSIQKSMVS